MIPAAAESRDILRRLGVPEHAFAGTGLATRSPIDGSAGPVVAQADPAAVDAAVSRSVAAFHAWKRVPAPRRGDENSRAVVCESLPREATAYRVAPFSLTTLCT